MSTHWGLYCVDHDEDDGIDLNHMDDELRQLWGMRTELPRFIELAELTWADIPHYPMGGYTSIRFAIKHTDCNVVLADEYGRHVSLANEACPFHVTVELETFGCQLGTHSKGKHHFQNGKILIEWSN